MKTNHKFRPPVDLSEHWMHKGRKKYIEVFKRLGFNDICECNIKNDMRAVGNKRKRRNTNQWECTECRSLIWPMAYLYHCDECTEITLADHFPVRLDKDFYCDDCLSEIAANS